MAEFNYTIDPTSEEPIMLILKQIGDTTDEYGNVIEYGINGHDFCRELMTLDTMGKKRIQIWLNSVGGSVIDGYSILSGILNSKTKVDTYNIGVAASTAGWIWQAGRKRIMNDYAFFMGHNPSNGGGESDVLTKFRNGIIKIISERTWKDPQWVSDMLDKETYMDAEECLADNFCDEVTPTGTQNVRRMKTAETVTDKYKEALQIVNQFIPTKIKPTTMAEVTKFPNVINALSLHAEASEPMVVEAIEGMKNKIVIVENRAITAENELKAANSAKEALQKKYDDLCKDLAQIKSEMEEAEAEDRLQKATDMVTNFANIGKIKNDKPTLDKWINRAKDSVEDFEEIKSMLEDLPVNKEASKIEVTNIIGGGAPKNLAQRLSELAKKNGQK